MLNELVAKLSPDGLPAQAMQETVGKVLDAINVALQQFSEFSVQFTDGLQVLYSGANPTPVRLLSDSEKLRVGASIQVAFARITGFGFIVVDAADRLDPAGRGALLGMLLDSGVQALVLATPTNGNRPQAPGLAVYDLVDGHAVPAGQPGEVVA